MWFSSISFILRLLRLDSRRAIILFPTSILFNLDIILSNLFPFKTWISNNLSQRVLCYRKIYFIFPLALLWLVRLLALFVVMGEHQNWNYNSSWRYSVNKFQFNPKRLFFSLTIQSGNNNNNNKSTKNGRYIVCFLAKQWNIWTVLTSKLWSSRILNQQKIFLVWFVVYTSDSNAYVGIRRKKNPAYLPNITCCFEVFVCMWGSVSVFR